MISIVLPLWNKARYVARTVQSVLDQSFTRFELIVVDDGSTDGSADIVTSTFHDPRIRLIRQTNAGVSAARNRGIDEARFPYVAFIDGDDEWLPSHLDTLVRLIREHNDTCQVFATAYMLQTGNDIPHNAHIDTDKLPFRTPEGVMDNFLELATGINSPYNMSSFAASKEILARIGGFPTGIASGEDVITQARLALHSPVAYATTPSVIVHLGTEGRAERPIAHHEPLDGMFDNLLKESPRGGAQVRKFVSFWHKQQMVRAINQRKYRLALEHALRSLRLRPLQHKVYVAALLALYSSHTHTELASLWQRSGKAPKQKPS